MATLKITNNNSQADTNHDAYEIMLEVLAKAAYDKSVKWSETEPKILFRTNTENMYKAYLGFFKEDEVRQHYTCSACAHFFHRFANVVYVEDGEIHSLYWDENIIEDKFFKDMVRYFRTQVESGKIIYPFTAPSDAYYTDKSIDEYGYKSLGGFNHFYMPLYRKGIAHVDKYRTEDAARDYYGRAVKMIKTKWSDNVINTALNMAKSGDLKNKDSEGTFKSFIEVRDMAKNKSNAYLWELVYKYVNLLDHFNNSVEGSLLNDIDYGYPLKACVERFNEKMDPLNYMRPKSDPTSGNVAEAERIVAELGLVDSLKRKFCPLDECKSFIWREETKPEKASTEGVFGSVKTKDVKNNTVDTAYKSTNVKQVSLNYFINNVLPTVKSMMIECEYYAKYYFQYLTEAVAGAKPILKYDKLEDRNPISKYTYTNSVFRNDFNIRINNNKVVAIVPAPVNMNTGTFEDGVLFVIENCYDTKIYRTGGLALFPEILINELYPVRKTIESYSNNNKIAEPDPNVQYAAGVYYDSRSNYKLKLSVDTGDTKELYEITCFM